MGTGRYEFRDQISKQDRERRLNPIWRGVGCLLLVILALAGYGLSGWFLAANQENAWIYLPYELYYPPFVPPALSFLPPGFFIRVGIGLLVMIFGYGLLSIFYAIFFPIEEKETDAPPLKRRRRKNWRSRGR
jgi:hypothetical protein